jgi:hypothetical protein
VPQIVRMRSRSDSSALSFVSVMPVFLFGRKKSGLRNNTHTHTHTHTRHTHANTRTCVVECVTDHKMKDNE